MGFALVYTQVVFYWVVSKAWRDLVTSRCSVSPLVLSISVVMGNRQTQELGSVCLWQSSLPKFDYSSLLAAGSNKCRKKKKQNEMSGLWTDVKNVTDMQE